MYFEYEDWRCQLRDKKVTLSIRPFNRIITHTEFWFYHRCDHPNKKPMSKTQTQCPTTKHEGTEIKNDQPYLMRWCFLCGKRMPWEVCDYFSKACELWRLAAP